MVTRIELLSVQELAPNAHTLLGRSALPRTADELSLILRDLRFFHVGFCLHDAPSHITQSFRQLGFGVAMLHDRLIVAATLDRWFSYFDKYGSPAYKNDYVIVCNMIYKHLAVLGWRDTIHRFYTKESKTGFFRLLGKHKT